MEQLDLLDYKRQVLDLYARIRAEPDPETGWRDWVVTRDRLFKTHQSSALPEAERAAFTGLPCFDHDPAARVLAELTPSDGKRFEIPTSGEDAMAFTSFAVARFTLFGQELELEAYWLQSYGNGLFLPFADATSGKETYGAGRYLLDTVKGSDLGTRDGRLVLDFNLAYNPSCAYDPRWTCPLAPPANRLDVPVRVGEKSP
ncbi:MAG: uncharacterized protein QOF57_1996 [Frankiaceae bacterium]|nr:uncharacterized protein [Frankiaceae bacterium]